MALNAGLGAGTQELVEGPLGVGLVHPGASKSLKALTTYRRLKAAHANAKGTMTQSEAFGATSDAISQASQYPGSLSSAQFGGQ